MQQDRRERSVRWRSLERFHIKCVDVVVRPVRTAIEAQAGRRIRRHAAVLVGIARLQDGEVLLVHVLIGINVHGRVAAHHGHSTCPQAIPAPSHSPVQSCWRVCSHWFPAMQHAPGVGTGGGGGLAASQVRLRLQFEPQDRVQEIATSWVTVSAGELS